MPSVNIIDKNMKMADVIHIDHTLLPVINRFNIQLGFGDKTIDEVCKGNQVNTDFFVEILNAFHDLDYFPKEQLQSFSTSTILNYLIKTHEYYIKVKLPEIEALINELINSCDIRKEDILLLKNFFSKYQEELISHISKEDEKVYPYIQELESSLNKGFVTDKFKKVMQAYSIADFATEHDNVEEKLNDLKNIIIKYLPPPKDSNLRNLVLFKLFELEKDLADHSRIEDKILIPMVTELEKRLKVIKG